MIDNFRWLIKDHFAGCGVPRTVEDIEWLKLRDFDTIISLSKLSPIVINKIKSLGFLLKEIPIEDYGTPEYCQIDRFLDFVDKELQEGHRILMHCYNGTGRTSTMFALFLVHFGDNWEKAVERCGGLETGSQRLCVQIYQDHLDAKVDLKCLMA